MNTDLAEAARTVASLLSEPKVPEVTCVEVTSLHLAHVTRVALHFFDVALPDLALLAAHINGTTTVTCQPPPHEHISLQITAYPTDGHILIAWRHLTSTELAALFPSDPPEFGETVEVSLDALRGVPA